MGLVVLARLVREYLAKHPSQDIALVGRTNERGTKQYNLALGKRRSRLEKYSFIMFGVNPSRLHVILLAIPRTTKKKNQTK